MYVIQGDSNRCGDEARNFENDQSTMVHFDSTECMGVAYFECKQQKSPCQNSCPFAGASWFIWRKNVLIYLSQAAT